METDSADKSDSTGFMPFDESRPPLPSKVPYNELQPILISQMQLQTYHLGRRTVVQVVPPTIRHKHAILAAVRDEAGTMSGVQLQATCQPFEEVVPAEQILRDGRWYLIKEPMALRNAKGNLRLIVEHPGDIILLPPYHELIPGDSRISKNVFGNDSVGRKSWSEAEHLYSIAVRTAETAEETNLAYLNRSLANLRLGRPALALADAIKSNATGVPTEKSLFREPSALYDLAKYDQCLEKLQALKTTFPANKSTIPMIDRVKARLKEQQTGQYDFSRMYEQVKSTPPIVDCATYTMPVEIRDSPGKGRGVFTKRKVIAGELLICEKAFGYIYSDTDRPMTVSDVQYELVAQIVQKLFHNIEDARMFSELPHGDYNVVPVDKVDGKPVIDSFLVRRVVKITNYRAPRTCRSLLGEMISGDFLRGEGASTTAGVWPFISHINHSCIYNIRYASIGDMLIVRAARDLEAGAEIFSAYEAPMAFESYEDTQKRLSGWGFTCDCALCLDRQATPNEVFLKRKALEMQCIQCMQMSPARAPTTAQKLFDQLDQTYSDAAKPPGAVRMEVWFFCLSFGTMATNMGMDSLTEDFRVQIALKGLEALGFIVSVNPEFRVLKWGLPQKYPIDAFRTFYLADKTMGPQNALVAKGYMEIAYSLFVGEKETILDTYPEVE